MGRRIRRLIDRWAPMVSQDDPQAISRLDWFDGVPQRAGRHADKDIAHRDLIDAPDQA